MPDAREATITLAERDMRRGLRFLKKPENTLYHPEGKRAWVVTEVSVDMWNLFYPEPLFIAETDTIFLVSLWEHHKDTGWTMLKWAAIEPPSADNVVVRRTVYSTARFGDALTPAECREIFDNEGEEVIAI